MFYLSTYLQWFASYRWKAVKQDDKSAFAVPKGHSVSIRRESGQHTLSNFPEILLKLSLPHMMNICNIWTKSVKEWHDYEAF